MIPNLIAKEKLTAFRSIIKAVSIIHNMGYLHRDINPQNFLANRNMEGDLEVKLTDFDFTIPVSDGLNNSLYRDNRDGTAIYFSPERWKPNSNVTTKDDVWAAGITLLSVFGIESPWHEILSSSPALPKIIRYLKMDWLNELCGSDPIARTKLWTILEQLLAVDPSKRADLLDINLILEKIVSKDEDEIITLLESYSILAESDDEAGDPKFTDEMERRQKVVSTKKRKEQCSSEDDSKMEEVHQGPKKRRKTEYN